MPKQPILTTDDWKQIKADKFRLLNEHLLTSMPIAYVCALIIFLSAYSAVDHALLISWLIAVTGIFLIRFIFFFFYRLYPAWPHHEPLFLLGVILTAIAWGLAGTVLMPDDHPLIQAITIIVIAGVTAGGMQTLQADKTAIILYILISLVPLSTWVWLQQTTHYYLLGVALTVYIIFLLATARRANKLIMSEYQLRYENIAINSRIAKTNELLKIEIQKHKQSEKSLAQLAEIVQFSKDAIISLDKNGMIMTWNKGAQSLYGYTAAEAIGKSITELSSESEAHDIEVMLTQVIENVSFQNIELERKHRSGQLIPVEVTLSPIKNEAGEVIGISSIDRDISERKEVDKMKNEFISVVSHELRTPLTSIKGSIGILLNKLNDISPQQIIALLEIAYNNCDRLIRLINDILDIEKIESGKLQFKFSTINMNTLIKNSIEEMHSYVEKFQVHLNFITTEELFIRGDYDRLMQVMTNLISNAVKFSYPNESVEIVLEKVGQQAKVAITDHGEGIPQDFKTKIFDKFTQADSSSTRHKGGTGLGLSICKAILEKHHSDLQFISSPGKGTTFYFYLPLASVEVKSTHLPYL